MIFDISEGFATRILMISNEFQKKFQKISPQTFEIYKPRSSSTGPVSASFLYPSIVLFDPAIGINSKPDISTSLVTWI